MITDEMVKAAALALVTYDNGEIDRHEREAPDVYAARWLRWVDENKDCALAVLEAVAPMIRDAALEEAAKVARHQIANYPLRTMLTDPEHADRVAAAIRAIKGGDNDRSS